MTNVDTLGLFDKDLKKLRKKYPSIDDDLNNFIKALSAKLPDGLPDTYRIPLGKEYASDPIYKVKKFRCRSLVGHGSRSGIRIVYGYNSSLNKITLIEIYHKNDKEDHDNDRIIQFLKTS
jgi:mRNA-degrading endonuclease RelE of RelBE toxin-antitoxin system